MKVGYFSRPAAATGIIFTLLFVVLGFVRIAGAGLSEADRITLEQPACAQMKSFSQDITLLNDEMQNLKRSKNRRRVCDVVGRAVTTIGSTVGYMQSHIGECTITVATIDQMATLGRQLEDDRRRACR
jgi:hypothetical protein